MESDQQADVSVLSSEAVTIDSSSGASVAAPVAKRPKAAPKSLTRAKGIPLIVPETAGPAAGDLNPGYLDQTCEFALDPELGAAILRETHASAWRYCKVAARRADHSAE